MCTLVSMTLAVNFVFGTAGVVDTSGKFATGIKDTSFNDNGCKITTGVKLEQYQTA
jgi:hypothetical protein